MRAGPMRHLLTYQTPAESSVSLSDGAPQWMTVGTFYFEVRTPNGREAFNASQQKATLSHVLTGRWPGFLPDPAGRYLEGQAVYNISAAFDPDGRGRTLTVYATRSVMPAEAP